MNWEVVFTQKAAKQADRLNTAVLSALRLLVEDLMTLGPNGTTLRTSRAHLAVALYYY